MNPDLIRKRNGYRYLDTAPDSLEPAVVLLHGMIGEASNWRYTADGLADAGLRIVVPELPIYTIDLGRANVYGLLAFLDDFFNVVELSDIILGGNSMGGQLALLYATSRPGVVRGLILSGASGITEVDLGSSIIRRRDRAYLRSRAELTFYDPVHCTEELMDEIMEIVSNRASVLRLISFARSVQNTSVRPLLQDVCVPTLIVWGKDDNITPVSVAHTLDRQIERTMLRVMDGCGHAPMMEHPLAFNHTVLEFLRVHQLARVEEQLVQ